MDDLNLNGYNFSKLDDLDLINLPSTAYNYDNTVPGWVSSELTAVGASFRLNTISGNSEDNNKVTELRWRS